MMLSAISLVKEKELGTLEQLLVTPVKKQQLMAGKLVPYLIITLAQLQVAIVMAGLIFKLQLAGSYWLLMLFSGIYLFTTLGLGILISTKVGTQQQAMFFSWFIMVIFILLSGFFVPVRNMPPRDPMDQLFQPSQPLHDGVKGDSDQGQQSGATGKGILDSSKQWLDHLQYKCNQL
ncbi:MAG: ABC transporter permease subunit [Candidatus Cloacimonetes bacterium]|nr:ABC transporter permease subunit [Candidatus Cloacimonadota bacterium]